MKQPAPVHPDHSSAAWRTWLAGELRAMPASVRDRYYHLRRAGLAPDDALRQALREVLRVKIESRVD